MSTTQNPEMVTCGTCKGKGEVNALTNFKPYGKPRRVTCQHCGGEGSITAERQS